MVMSDLFGSLVFNDTVMQERLPKYTYKELKSCIANDTPISLTCATVIAMPRPHPSYQSERNHRTSQNIHDHIDQTKCNLPVRCPL